MCFWRGLVLECIVEQGFCRLNPRTNQLYHTVPPNASDGFQRVSSIFYPPGAVCSQIIFAQRKKN
jgi:hypothetical protein